MKKSQINILLIASIITLFLSSCYPSGIARNSQSLSSSKEKISNSNDEATITCYISGIPHSQVISYESGAHLKELFSALATAHAKDMYSAETKNLEQQILQYAEEHNLFQDHFSAEIIQKNLNTQTQRVNTRNIEKKHTDLYEGTSHEFFCNFVSTGEGSAFPIIILPRLIPILMTPIPRVFVGWNTHIGFTSVGGLVSRTGFIAQGDQKGFALGFWGIGFSIFLPPIMSYGILGYALYTKVSAEEMEYWPPNNPPFITQTDPTDGQQMVPTSTDTFSFEITDEDGDLMSYDVTTYPDIGSGSGGLKPDGIYSIILSGLDSLTTYTCSIQVTDGKDTIEKTITFTTEPTAPLISNPIPYDNERDVPMNLPELQFTLKDYQGDAMEYTVQTSPDIGSDHKTGVHDGTYTVPISGMTYGAEYHWFVNVTDGTHWARKMYSFTSGYPSPFDPFDYGWQYRKQIFIDHVQVAGDLVKFPILISVTDSDLIKAQADGDDLLFMNSSGIAIKLSHELEIFNQSSGKLLAWVTIPLLSSNEDTVFYMYYGNPTCISQENPEKTWDAKFCGVWHLKETAGTRYDSTNNHKDCLTSGTTHTQSSKIDGGEIFNADADRISTINPINQMTTFTLECWFTFDGTAADTADVILQIAENKPSVFRYTDNKLHVWTGYYEEPLTSIHTFSDTNWHYLTLVSTGSELKLYVDSVLEDSDFWSGTSNTEIFYLGNNKLDTDTFRGTIDEARISNTARDWNWIVTCYQNQNNPAGFILLGLEEPHP